jgi:hypothetical protein
MKNDIGVRVRTSADIDASCSIEYEVTGKQAFFSIADGAVSLHFTDEQAFRKFMGAAMKVLSVIGLDDSGDAVRVSG